MSDSLEYRMPKAGEGWRHTKTGRIYMVVTMALDVHTHRPVVIYKAASRNAKEQLFVRALESWLEIVRVGERREQRFVFDHSL